MRRAEDIQTALYDVAGAVSRYQDLSAKGATLERPGVSQMTFSICFMRFCLVKNVDRVLVHSVALYGIDNTRRLIADALAGAFIK